MNRTSIVKACALMEVYEFVGDANFSCVSLLPLSFNPQVCPNNLVRLYSAPSAKSSTLVVCGSAGPQCSLVDVRGMHKKRIGGWKAFSELTLI